MAVMRRNLRKKQPDVQWIIQSCSDQTNASHSCRKMAKAADHSKSLGLYVMLDREIHFLGMVKKNVAPFPSSDSTHMRPPCRSTIFFAIASPTPVPGYSSFV